MTSAALSRTERRSRIWGVRSAQLGWPALGALAVPEALLLVGAGVGYAFSLDRTVANERLLGLLAAALLSLAAASGLRHVQRAVPILVASASLGLLAGVWVIAASPPGLFHGVVGAALAVVFRPILGTIHLSESVDIDNTRFIVGYNGLADLCLVVLFASLGVLWTRPRWQVAAPLVAGSAVAGLWLVGADSRGGLTGLAVGLCLIAVYAWPRRWLLLALVAAPLGAALVALGILDKGLEFSSTAGRLTYWGDLARLLVEYPLTGVGLGVDTANRVALSYEINPDPARIFYAHNTFVETYLEQGPLGTLGMLWIPLLAVLVAVLARRLGVAQPRKPLLVAGLGLVGGLTAHGLTDQVVTTNVGTALLLLGTAAAIAALAPAGQQVLASWSRRAALGVLIGMLGVGVLTLSLPLARAQALLDLGGLRLNQALALDPQDPARPGLLADASATLSAALQQAPDHPAVLRELALARSAEYDDAGALQALAAAARSPRLDAFDQLQIAHVYRRLGAVDQAYRWAAQAYAAWGRPPDDAVMQTYAQATLTDDRARVLASQAEAAMQARAFSQALSLFEQALTFEHSSPYLIDRVGAAQRAVDKYGG